VLGIRLNSEVEARFERFVRRRGQRKSEVGRTAIIEYMDRHEADAEFMRQVRLLNEQPLSESERKEAERRTDDWLAALDAKDGGYDWGPEGPPL
jgi:hypothetical protein